nr:TolC family protein [Pseudomonadales bacterium]
MAHPSIAAARAKWQVLKSEAEVARRKATASPTVGLSGGRDGGENVVGLTFSIPLNVRNNYSAEIRAANRRALEAEARFQALYRKQQYDLAGARASWKRYDKQLRRWKELSQGRVQRSADLLEKQW